MRQIRDGVELAPIFEDKHYDFNFQDQQFLKEQRTIKRVGRIKIFVADNKTRMWDKDVSVYLCMHDHV